TSQPQRMSEWLHPESISLHGFTQKDWLRYAYESAKEIRYFSTDLPEFPQGNWESFFVANEDLDNFVKEVESRQNTEPHLALFIAFLKLIAFSQQQLNQVSRRHLDFYYQEVLQFHKREFVADHVFVVFELAKNVLNYRLEQGSVLDAGKDALKKNLAYGLRHELIVNTAVATQFKSILHQKGSSLRYADVAPTADGIGQPVDPNNPTWFAFGQDGSTTGFATLPAVKTGFALASGVLAMQEGQRSIHLELSLEVPSDFDTNVFAPLAAHTTALITGESHWVPMIIHTASVTKNNLTAKLSMDLELAAKDEA